MNIHYHGYNCFELSGKDVTMLIDPFTAESGLAPTSVKADIITISKEDSVHANTDGLKEDGKIFSWPGEYEVKDVSLRGIAANEGNQGGGTIYCAVFEGFKICHLGDLGERLSEKQLEEIGDIDILMVPVGNTNALDAKKALDVVEQVDPRIVIPMHYDVPGISAELGSVEQFCEVMGHKDFEKASKFSPAKLPDDKTDLIVLKASCE